MHEVSLCRTPPHPFYLRSSEKLLVIDVPRPFSLYSKIKQKSGLKHPSFQTAGCHSHSLTSKGIYSQLNIKLLVFQYKARLQHIMLRAVSWKSFLCSWKIRKCCCMPFQAISQKTGCDVVHQIHSLPQFFPFIQLLNLQVCFLAVLFVSFCFKTHIPFVIWRLHFAERVDLYNFHGHQSIGLSSLESLNKWAKPQVLSRRCGFKQLKSTFTKVFMC